MTSAGGAYAQRDELRIDRRNDIEDMLRCLASVVLIGRRPSLFVNAGRRLFDAFGGKKNTTFSHFDSMAIQSAR